MMCPGIDDNYRNYCNYSSYNKSLDLGYVA